MSQGKSKGDDKKSKWRKVELPVMAEKCGYCDTRAEIWLGQRRIGKHRMEICGSCRGAVPPNHPRKVTLIEVDSKGRRKIQ